MVERLPHGYTNDTRRIGDVVEKRYEGRDSLARAAREFTCLTRLLGRFAVPEVVRFDASAPLLVLKEVLGRHGQELIDEGQGPLVLGLIGNQLRELQSFPPSVIPGLKGTGGVIVHGDFGPQNVLCSPDLTSICAVVDWEFAHVGSPIEDLAWVEWIIRTHHPSAVEALPQLFAGSGLHFGWSERQAAMVLQCRHYIAYCDASEMDLAADQWRRRIDATEHWSE